MKFVQEIKDLVRRIMNKPPSVVRIIIKISFVWLGVLFWVSMYQLLWEETTGGISIARRVRYCDDLYYAKDYAGLREELYDFDLKDEAFDKYWEVVDGYNDYLQYVQYEKAVAAGHQESVERMEEYCQKVMDNVENCKFEDNKKRLGEYADKLTVQ